VNQNKLRFLEAFLAMCVLKDSPLIASAAEARLDQNHVTVARRGREPGLTLWRDDRQVSMRDWARELLDSMAGLCEMLDVGDPLRPYTNALGVQAAKLEDPALTPSARLLNELTATGESFFAQALRMSTLHKEYFLEMYAPNEERLAEFAAGAQESLERQRKLEAETREPIDTYLARYFAK
jgi:glutamate--cysteine ligase